MLTTLQADQEGWQFRMQLRPSDRRITLPDAGDLSPAPWLTEEDALHAGLDRARSLIDQAI
jgi:hypothetical protein